MQQEPIDLANVKAVYFDTSAWNYVSKHPRREELVCAIKKSGAVILASVISIAEVLRTPDPIARESICSIMRDLDGGAHPIERPQDVAVAAAEAFLRGEKDIILPRTQSGEAIYSHLLKPTSPPNKQLRDWLHNMDENLNRFIEKTRPQYRDSHLQYCTPEVLKREDFLRILCELPPIKHLKLSISQMSELSDASDVWKAHGAALAYMIELSATHAPRSKRGKKRPGGPDLWQTVYLGTSEIFVTRDQELLKAACRVSACLHYPRCVASAEDFVGGLLHSSDGSLTIQEMATRKCRLCGCNLPTVTGMHVAAVLS